MHEEIGSARTKSDDQLEIIRVLLPDETYGPVVSDGIPERREDRSERHNRIWTQFRQHVLQGGLTGMSVNVYLGYIGSQRVCVVPFFEGGYAAVVEDVSVSESSRNRGVCTAVLTSALADFKARGGEFVSIGPDESNLPAVRAYRKAGFSSAPLPGVCCVWIHCVLGLQFETDRFRPGQSCEVRPYRSDDGPKIHALACVLGIDNPFGCAYEELFYYAELRREADARVLASTNGTVFGFWCDQRPWRDDVAGWSIVHPDYADRAASLAQASVAEGGKHEQPHH